VSLYDRYLLPRVTDLVCGTTGIRWLRESTVEGLSGRVLEIGFGSGHNMDVLPPEVTELGAVEPSDTAWHLASERIAASPVSVSRVGLDAQKLDAADDSYDAALVTFALCTIPDPGAALEEVHRVLKPGGKLHFVEHGRAPDARVARLQRAAQPVWGAIAGGCHTGRPIDELVRDAGFELTVKTFYGARPKFAAYFYLGTGTLV
jgi:ubiquinone/menaquinone biosynthesis C-methylase UbiE